jgi:hypothetical protein
MSRSEYTEPLDGMQYINNLLYTFSRSQFRLHTWSGSNITQLSSYNAGVCNGASLQVTATMVVRSPTKILRGCGGVSEYTLPSGTSTLRYSGTVARVWALVALDDVLLSGDGGGYLTCWKGSTSAPWVQLFLTWTPVAIGYTPDKSRLITVGDSLGDIHVLKITQTAITVEKKLSFSPASGFFRYRHVLIYSNSIAYVSRDINSFLVLNLANPTESYEQQTVMFPDAPATATFFCFSPSKQTLYAGNSKGIVRSYPINAATGNVGSFIGSYKIGAATALITSIIAVNNTLLVSNEAGQLATFARIEP